MILALLSSKGTSTNWTEVVAIGTLFQCLVILIAAIVAASQLRESRRLRRAQTRPYVVVKLETTPVERSLVNLVIENIGATPALNVTFQVTPELTSSIDKPGDNRLTEWSVLSSGIPHFAPHQQVRTLLDSLITRMATESPFPRSYIFTTSYSGIGDKKPYRESIEINFGAFIGSHYVVEKGIHDVAKSIEEIHRLMKGWSEGFSAMRVLTGDLDAFRQRQKVEWNRRIAEHQMGGKQPNDEVSSSET